MAHVVQDLAALASRSPDRPLTYCAGRTQTAGAFAARVAALSSILTVECGLQVGDRVVLAAVNTDRTFEVILAILAAGGLVAPLNWRWSVQVDASNWHRTLSIMQAAMHTSRRCVAVMHPPCPGDLQKQLTQK